jgi:hypothetical protein
MRSIKLVGLALGAVLALSAVSVASASATELIKFSKTGNFEGKQTTETELETSTGKRIPCKTATAKGKITSEIKGEALLELGECKTTAFIFEGPCTSAGSSSGKIHIPTLLILLGSDENPEVNMNPALLLKIESPVVFKCEVAGQSATLTVTGSLICLVKNAANKTEIERLCEKGAKSGEQKDKKFWDIGETNQEDTLRTSSTGAEEFTNLESNILGNALFKGVGTTIQIEV